MLYHTTDLVSFGEGGGDISQREISYWFSIVLRSGVKVLAYEIEPSQCLFINGQGHSGINHTHIHSETTTQPQTILHGS